MDKKWTITGTRNAEDFLHKGTEILEQGGTAIDAVENVIKEVENNPFDLTVGFNGFPNLLGQVELDASIMIGSTLKAGAVAGVQNFKNAISIARKILELSPHVLLVGKGAEQFASAIGFKPDKIIEDRVVKLYQNVIRGKNLFEDVILPEALQKVAWRYDKYLKEQLESFDFLKWYSKLEHHGTVNVMAIDQSGEVCSGVSTSGLALKFPGRAGDSPLIGSGNYCDSKVGSAACVGTGEIAIRLGLARITIERMKQHQLDNALKMGIKDVLNLAENGVIQILAMDKHHNVQACSNQKLHFVLSTSENPTVMKRDSMYLNHI